MIKTRIAAAVLMLSAIFSSQAQDMTPRQAGDKLSALLSYIEMAYVDSASVDALTEAAIVSILGELDPHSFYLSRKELEEANEELSGNFEGIGIQFQIFRDTILVISAITGGPSEKAGLRAGDKIISIDGKNATGRHVDNEFVFRRLRGDSGTEVKVGVLRKGRQEATEYTLVRDKIPITSLDAAFMAGPVIGYVKLNRFAQNTMIEYHAAVKALRKLGMQKLILDLRNNSGGYLFAAAELADQFLTPGRLIVYTEGLNSPRQDMDATWLGSFEKGDLCILIDEGSASASEIVAGAIQDWDRGVIIGRRSFGKGLVQKQYSLTDGSAIRLTTARYYTPSGRSIQKPYDNGMEDYYLDLNTRFEHGEFVSPDSIQFPDSLRYSTKGGRTVYGGGGIMPDIFVPWDSTAFTDLYGDLAGEGILNDVVLAYTENERPGLMEKFPGISDFLAGYSLPVTVLDDVVASAQSRGMTIDGAQMERSRELILSQLKALVARNLYDIQAYFQVIMGTDPAYLKAVEVLNDKELQQSILQN